MASLRINILTNYAGQLWTAAIGVAFLPLYIRILGMEAFGMVGLMLSFQSVLQLLDFGIGGAINRELSRRVHNQALADGARDLVRTSETVIWLTTMAAALLVWVCSGLIADHWLHLQSMKRTEARSAIAIIGIAIASLWPSTFYANCLSGLERQPKLNFINGAFSTLRYVGALPILIWVSPSLLAFLWWFAIVGGAQSLTTAIVVWQELPAGSRSARWNLNELRSGRRFAGGLFITGLLALAVGQFDRFALVSLRPLADLGYYTLALSIASGLGRTVQPMFNALYPRFSRLIARRDEATVCELYHLSSQYLAVVIAATAATLIVFSRQALFLWTGDALMATKVALPLTILVAGYALNGLMNIPYALQLADGWTRLATGLNAASLALGIPFCLWAVRAHGAAGAALMWLLANLTSVVIGIPIMHRRLLRSEMSRWYFHDNLPPIVAALATALSLYYTLPQMSRTIEGWIWLALESFAVLIASALASNATRRAILTKLPRLF